MRAFVKTEETWKPITLPADIVAWMREQVGKEAVIIDDDSAVYFCNSADTFNDYAAKGKRVSLFYYLERRLMLARVPVQDSLI
jgi:hypothetical protein